MVVALSKAVSRRSFGNQRALTGVASSPWSSRSTWPAYRLPKRVIMAISLPVDHTPRLRPRHPGSEAVFSRRRVGNRRQWQWLVSGHSLHDADVPVRAFAEG